MSRPCLFLDRDGVINEPARRGEYINTWDEFRFLPNVADWIRLFNALDYLVIVVTNQRGVALGHTKPEDLEEIHRKMVASLAEVGARIDDIFCCPHDYEACDCRKPRPGLVKQACRKWKIDLKRSLLVGDTELDEEFARNCGLRFVLATGSGHVFPAFETVVGPAS
jgi:D-glycero-D-manno-heptose 1,7-bisphosphate phosphatase